MRTEFGPLQCHTLALHTKTFALTLLSIWLHCPGLVNTADDIMTTGHLGPVSVCVFVYLCVSGRSIVDFLFAYAVQGLALIVRIRNS